MNLDVILTSGNDPTAAVDLIMASDLSDDAKTDVVAHCDEVFRRDMTPQQRLDSVKQAVAEERAKMATD